MNTSIEWPGIPLEFERKFKNTGYEESDASLAELEELEERFGEYDFDEASALGEADGEEFDDEEEPF